VAKLEGVGLGRGQEANAWAGTGFTGKPGQQRTKILRNDDRWRTVAA